MIKKILLLWFLFIASASASEVKLFARASNFFDIEPVYNKTFEHGWDSPFFGGDSAIALKEYEVGAVYGPLSMSLVKKDHTWISFLPETAEMIHAAINKQPLDPSRSYQISIDANVYQLDGVKLAYSFWAKPKFSAQLGLNYYRASSLLYGSVDGVVTANAVSDYSFQNVVLDYFYPKDELFFNEAPPPTGSGYSLDMVFSWQLARTAQWNLSVRDLFGFIDWQSSPFTTATIDSDTKSFDEDGYVKFSPTLSGHQGAKNFRQPLVAIMDTEIVFELTDDVSGSTEFMYTPYESYVRIGVSRKIESQNFGIKYNPQDQVVHLRWESSLGSLGIASNHANLSFARVTGIDASLHYSF